MLIDLPNSHSNHLEFQKVRFVPRIKFADFEATFRGVFKILSNILD